MKQIALNTCDLYQAPGRVIQQIKDFLKSRTTGTFIVEDQHQSSCLGCDKADRREWAEPEEHTCGQNSGA